LNISLDTKKTILENRLSFMLGWSTMKDIFLLRRLVKKYRETNEDHPMILIDLQKAYNKLLKEVIWWVIENKIVP
jgi:hypothetical protein